MANLNPVLPVSVLLALAACNSSPSPRYFVETPVGSGVWHEVPALPPWAGAAGKPAIRVGFFRIVMDSSSNLRPIAASSLDTPQPRAVAARLRGRLDPSLDAAQVDELAAGLAPKLVLVERVCCDKVLTTRPVPGNTSSTAWGLYEVPEKDLLGLVPALRQDSVRAALHAR